MSERMVRKVIDEVEKQILFPSQDVAFIEMWLGSAFLFGGPDWLKLIGLGMFIHGTTAKWDQIKDLYNRYKNTG